MLPKSGKLDTKALGQFVDSSRKDYESALRRLVEIPSISMAPEHAPDVRRCAEAAADLIERRGGKARILKSPGNPVIVGRFATDRTHPTVSIYNHMDVQPANEPEWVREPFKMKVEKDRFHGRGSTDDKGPALSVLFAAGYAHSLGIPLNIQFIWELEEEIGSPNFDAFLGKHARELASDAIVVSDTVWLAAGKPVISTGLRGLQGATLRLETGTKEVHSGLTGGAARNPLLELSTVLAALHDPKTGRVRIDGFYDDVVAPSKAELRSFARAGFSVAEFKRVHGLTTLRQRDAIDVMQAIWSKPTFEVHGIAGGYQGPGLKTSVPPFAEAKVSLRLVPNQTPAKAFRALKAQVKRLNPDVHVEPFSSLAPYKGETTGKVVDAGLEAIRFGFGKTPAFVREGGSIGAVMTLEKHLGCPVQLIGLSLPEHGYHAPNEYFDWGQAAGGMKSFAKYFELLSRLRKR
jgi:acetylornithine deacetylase/succinyl-diaminopimelate desuccinylase-like protein